MNNDAKCIFNGSTYQNRNGACINYDSLEELTVTSSCINNSVCQNNEGLDDDKDLMNTDHMFWIIQNLIVDNQTNTDLELLS